MSAVPNLKKKLKGINATKKLSKALKTVSAAKYAKLSAQFKCFSEYALQYRELFKTSDVSECDKAPETVVVFGSCRGFCGGFNNDILQYLKNNIFTSDLPQHLIVLGEKMGNVITEDDIKAEKILHYDSTPQFSEIDMLYNIIWELAAEKNDYRVVLVYPAYKNTMNQVPTQTVLTVHPSKAHIETKNLLVFPDSEALVSELSNKYLRSVLYGVLLETALGSQAATMMTMRSAFDTATEMSGELERKIQRKRQQDVTSDVLETAADIINREKGADM